jgi:hypothetical protein
MLRREFLLVSPAVTGLAAAHMSAVGTPTAQATSILEYGANPNGKTLNTTALQRAIDDTFRAGGGIVYVPPGTFLTGSIELKSRVTLYLEAGATLLGSTSINDYTSRPGPLVSGDAARRHLIFAQDADDIGLAGPGRIDGQGPTFWEPSGRPPLPPEEQWADVTAHAWKPKATGRPSPMLEFVACRRLRIQSVRVENSPGWTMRAVNCDDVYITAVTVKNPNYGPNTDGVDIAGCQNVFVSNCSIETGDDAICLKSENPYGPEPRLSRNIVVTNCVLTTCCNGFKLGTASEGGFENITFSNSVIYNSQDAFKDRVISGVALEVVDGGWIDGVAIAGIQMKRTRTPIFIRLGDRTRPHVNSQRGLCGISIENIHSSEALLASSITGLPGMEVEDVTLSNIRVDNVLPCRPEWVGRTVPEVANKYPEARMFGMLPASGLYARHVRGLRLDNIAFSATPSEGRPTIIFDTVKEARISGLQTTPIAGSMPVVQLTNTSDVWISESAAPANATALVSVEGAGSSNILLSGNDCRGASNAFRIANEVSPKAVTLSGNVCADRK